MKQIFGIVIVMVFLATPLFSDNLDDDPLTILKDAIYDAHVEIILTTDGMDGNNSNRITGIVYYVLDNFIVVSGEDYDWIVFIHDIAAIKIINKE
jgi:hypothetical protein